MQVSLPSLSTVEKRKTCGFLFLSILWPGKSKNLCTDAGE